MKINVDRELDLWISVGGKARIKHIKYEINTSREDNKIAVAESKLIITPSS